MESIDKEKIVSQIISDFEASYVYFILEKNFHDSSVVRAAYYAVCERMIQRNPPPEDELDPMVQSAVLERLVTFKDDAMRDYVDSIERIFDEVSQGVGARRLPRG